MDSFEKGLKVMTELFGRDYQFALATAADNVPSLRFIDTYFHGGCFYAVTYKTSRKMKEIAANPDVALCSKTAHSFAGKARDMGHPLNPENSGTRRYTDKNIRAVVFQAQR